MVVSIGHALMEHADNQEHLEYHSMCMELAQQEKGGVMTPDRLDQLQKALDQARRQCEIKQGRLLRRITVRSIDHRTIQMSIEQFTQPVFLKSYLRHC